MFKRNLVPLWAAIIIVASMYLMGQGWSPPSGPRAPVPKTGQTTVYAIGDDGHLQKGVTWPDPRFADNGNGTVTDNLTGLVWTQDAGCDGKKTWSDAVNYCNILVDGGCGLSDGSDVGDWRLPNVRELHSLIDYQNHLPALPTGHPFTNVEHWYWVSTTIVTLTTSAMTVGIDGGVVFYDDKGSEYWAWCVRDGQ